MQAGKIDQAGVAGQAENRSLPRLVQAAQEFEGLMMKELLKPMANGGSIGGDDSGDADAGAGGALGEFASEALGQAVSRQGGLGIAHSIVRDLTRSGNYTNVRQVTGLEHQNTV